MHRVTKRVQFSAARFCSAGAWTCVGGADAFKGLGGCLAHRLEGAWRTLRCAQMLILSAQAL